MSARPDDSRRGWISGLGEAEGERHPTLGGLRIGKELPERRAGEPFDERLDPVHRRSPSWTGHEEINRVMLATSQAPGGYLGEMT